ncbi:MAG: carbonic anhydrase [Chloroflexi bacterium]|nr:carbonic anhydrase [Chloroflexota bacterium]
MAQLEELLEANRRYSQGFDRGGRAAAPARRLAVVTCMDARIHPERLLGLDIGDAHVIRNAGGRVSDDVIRSLIISSRLLGTDTYLVIHHTDCGMQKHSNAEIRRMLREETSADASSMDFLVFTDLEQSVRDDVVKLRRSPYLRREVSVYGFVYDVQTGLLHAVGE